MNDKSREFAYPTEPIAGDTPVRPFQKGDYDGDVAHFSRDIENDPDNPVAYENRGYAHYLNDDYDLAIADFTEAIRLDPENARLYSRRGSAHEDKECRQGNELAIADYGEWMRLDPTNAGAYASRGRVHARIGNHGAAVRDLSAAIDLDPTPAYYDARGCNQHRNGNYDAAIADFTEAIRLDPSKATVFSRTPGAFAGRGRTHAAKGDLDRAIADYDEAVRLGITSSTHLYRDRGFAWYRKGDYQRAKADFDKALNFHSRLPADQAASLYLARGHCHAGREAERYAVSDFSEAVRLDPDNASAREALDLARAKRSRSWLSLFRWS